MTGGPSYSQIDSWPPNEFNWRLEPRGAPGSMCWLQDGGKQRSLGASGGLCLKQIGNLVSSVNVPDRMQPYTSMYGICCAQSVHSPTPDAFRWEIDVVRRHPQYEQQGERFPGGVVRYIRFHLYPPATSSLCTQSMPHLPLPLLPHPSLCCISRSRRPDASI